MLGSPVTIASDSRSSIGVLGFRVSWDIFSLFLLIFFFFLLFLVGCLEYVMGGLRGFHIYASI